MLGRSLAALSVCVGVIVGCNTSTLTNAPPPTRNEPNVTDEPVEDAEPTSSPSTSSSQGEPTTTPDASVGGDPRHPPDSPCPAPAKITTANVPSGYLAPVTVTIGRLIDGDSDSFHFPNARAQGVRMLYVNTEESGGPEMTPFGIEAKGIVHGWIRAATKIEIAVREGSPGSGVPDLDPYDRWLALVFLDGELLQARIVREGLSAYYTQFGCAPPPIHDALLLGEAEANHSHRGIWSSKSGHNDYEKVFQTWIGHRTCRPNPFKGQPYCP